MRKLGNPDPDLSRRVAALDVCQDCASECILNQRAIKTNISLHFIKPSRVIASDTSRGSESLTVHFFPSQMEAGLPEARVSTLPRSKQKDTGRFRGSSAVMISYWN